MDSIIPSSADQVRGGDLLVGSGTVIGLTIADGMAHIAYRIPGTSQGAGVLSCRQDAPVKVQRPLA